MIGGVVLVDQLRDTAIRADDVMRRQDARGILEPPDCPFEHHDRPVVDDELDPVPIATDAVVAGRHRASPLNGHLLDETA